MKTIDRLLLKAKQMQMTVVEIPPVFVKTEEEIAERCKRFDKKYGVNRWKAIFMIDDLWDDDDERWKDMIVGKDGLLHPRDEEHITIIVDDCHQ